MISSKLKSIITCLVLLGVLSVFVYIWVLGFYRYPSHEELREYFSNEPKTKVIAVDTSQEEAGLVGLTVESPSGKEEILIEVVPQWVFPWQEYDWGIADK